MASAQSNKSRDWRRGPWSRLCRGAICSVEDHRGSGPDEQRPHRQGEVCPSESLLRTPTPNSILTGPSLRRRFEQNQEDCTFTVLALLPTATEDILDALPVENITHQLQQKKAERAGRSASAGTSEVAASEMSSGPPSVAGDDGKSLSSFQSEGYIHASQMAASTTGSANMGLQTPKKSKAQLWNELKIKCGYPSSWTPRQRARLHVVAITRSYTLLYTVSLLTLLTRIQLNLLGRRNYLSSVVSLASHPLHESTISLENHDDVNAEQEYGSDFETNRKFLTFSWWLLHRGWRDIMERVEAAVKEDFGPLNPREDITMERLSALTLDIRRKVEGATEEERRYVNEKDLCSIEASKLTKPSEIANGSRTSSHHAIKKSLSSKNPA